MTENQTPSLSSPEQHYRHVTTYLRYITVSEKLIGSLRTAMNSIITDLRSKLMREARQKGFAEQQIQNAERDFPSITFAASVDGNILSTNMFESFWEHLNTGKHLDGFHLFFAIALKYFPKIGHNHKIESAA